MSDAVSGRNGRLGEAAFQMLREARKAAPVIFSKAGPGCLYAPCTEGEFYCGKIKR